MINPELAIDFGELLEYEINGQGKIIYPKN